MQTLHYKMMSQQDKIFHLTFALHKLRFKNRIQS